MAIFLSACLVGIIVCLAYNVIRVFRRIIKHNLFWISVQDFLFWIGTGVYLFLEMYRTCNGSIRWYFVIGVLCGAGLAGWITVAVTKKLIDKSTKTE